MTGWGRGRRRACRRGVAEFRSIEVAIMGFCIIVV